MDGFKVLPNLCVLLIFIRGTVNKDGYEACSNIGCRRGRATASKSDNEGRRGKDNCGSCRGLMALASAGDTVGFEGRRGAYKGCYRGDTDHLALNAYKQAEGGVKESAASKNFGLTP